MQLPESAATASYRRVRNFLYVITGFSLLLAITGSFWLAKTVTRPVQDLARSGTAHARRRLQRTDQHPRRPTSSASSPAASTRCRRRSRTASGASSIRRITTACRGCRTASSSSVSCAKRIERHETMAVVSLGLDRFNGIVSSLGHRAGDEVVKLAAAALRSASRRGRSPRPPERPRVRHRPAGPRRARSRRVDRVPSRRAARRRARRRAPTSRCR